MSEFLAEPLRLLPLSPLTAGDIEAFRDWAQAEAVRVAEDRIALLDKHGCIAPWEKRQILDTVYAANASGRSEEIVTHSRQGVITMAWLSARHHSPGITREQVSAMVPAAAVADLEQRLAALNGARAETPPEDAPQADDPVPVTFAEMAQEAARVRTAIFDRMCESAGKTPKQLCDLTIEEIETLYKQHATEDKEPVDRLKLRGRLLEYAGINPAQPPAPAPL